MFIWSNANWAAGSHAEAIDLEKRGLGGGGRCDRQVLDLWEGGKETRLTQLSCWSCVDTGRIICEGRRKRKWKGC